MALHRAAGAPAAGEHLVWQKKNLSYEAWSRASEEFSESDLPSLATIQRHMADIQKGGSGVGAGPAIAPRATAPMAASAAR